MAERTIVYSLMGSQKPPDKIVPLYKSSHGAKIFGINVEANIPEHPLIPFPLLDPENTEDINNAVLIQNEFENQQVLINFFVKDNKDNWYFIRSFPLVNRGPLQTVNILLPFKSIPDYFCLQKEYALGVYFEFPGGKLGNSEYISILGDAEETILLIGQEELGSPPVYVPDLLPLPSRPPRVPSDSLQSEMLLDLIPGAIAAYSIRKLRRDYVGPALRVVRGVGEDWRDIGFDDSGNLDTAGILSFVGAEEAKVVTWYNQADVLEPLDLTEGSPPLIARDGKILTGYHSSKPFLLFEGSFLRSSLRAESVYDQFSCLIVYGIDNNTIPQYPLNIGEPIANRMSTEVVQFGLELGPHSNLNPNSIDIFGHYGHDKRIDAQGINSSAEDKLIEFFLDKNIGSAQLWWNGVSLEASSVGGFPEKLIKVYEKYDIGGLGLKGRISEIVIYPDADKVRQADSRLVAELNMGRYYQILAPGTV